MAEAIHTQKKASGLPPVVKIIIIVFVVLFLLGTILSFVIGKIVKKAGTTILNKAIENKTGMQTSIEDLEKGKMTFTDPKTGAKVEINSGKIPEDFPKNFPLYPGANLTTTLSGNSKDDESGFWLTFSTKDSLSKVADYFKTNLKTNGWETKMAFETDQNTTFGVSNDNLEGSVTITRAEGANETSFVIMLGEK